MKRAYLALALFAFAPGAFPQDAYQNQLFTISAPVPSGGYVNSQPVLMSLPYSQGFAPNVNVQVQGYTDSLESYVRLSEAQFRSLNWKVIRKQLNGNKALFEYSGDYNGRAMHWYSEATRHGNAVYLVTATALVSHWPTYSERLIASVRSFRLRR